MPGLMSWIKDLLFPKFCAGCEKEGSWLCEKCLPAVLAGGATEPNGCAAVGGEAGFPAAGLPQEEKAVSHLNGITALFDYGENTLSKLIKMFKYNYLLDITDIFEKIINKVSFSFDWQGFTIIFVPLHARREREREFNQAEILAKLFAEKLGLEINANLRRVIYTTQQARLSGEQRRNNLKNAFIWDVGAKTAPEKVLLVDDVFTTGATMQECAKVLKNNGVKIVWGLALAKG